MARQAFAVVKALDLEQAKKLPTVFTVFRMYCQEELSAAQIARECRCSKATVINRLNLLRRKLGRRPQELRRYSGHLEKVADCLAEPRARRVYRMGTLDDGAEGEEQ